VVNIPLICRQESEVHSTHICLWEIFNRMAQCESDTLNAPADKLLLSKLIKLGGHSAISGCCKTYPKKHGFQIKLLKYFENSNF